MATAQVRSSQTAVSGPSGRRLLRTSDQSNFYLKYKTLKHSLSSQLSAEPLQELDTECYYPQHAGSNGLD